MTKSQRWYAGSETREWMTFKFCIGFKKRMANIWFAQGEWQKTINDLCIIMDWLMWNKNKYNWLILNSCQNSALIEMKFWVYIFELVLNWGNHLPQTLETSFHMFFDWLLSILESCVTVFDNHIELCSDFIVVFVYFIGYLDSELLNGYN